jgi:ADP-ribosylglycohydrolase
MDAARNLYGKSDLWEDLEALIDKAVSLAGNEGSDESNIKKLGEGWVAEEALAIALYCALRYENDFSACLIASVNHDGDSDSTGAVAGNILGALIGYDRIDEKWKKNLQFHKLLLHFADECAAWSVSE